MTDQSTELDTSEFFGGMPPAVTFEKVGDNVAGYVVDKRVRQQTYLENTTDHKKGDPVFWPNGDPKMEALLILQVYTPTDEDDGQRTLYIRSFMQNAMREGVRGARQADIHIGDYLAVEHTSVDKPTRRGVNGAKRFEAEVNGKTPDELPLPPSAESKGEPPF